MGVFSKKLVSVGLGSLVLGIGATVGVFAAIPDSNTKVITACRSNLNGSLRAIDAQAGANCNFLETSLSWSGDLTSPGGGTKTAIFDLKPDSNDPEFPYIYDPLHSRGVVNAQKLETNDLKGYCVDLGFVVGYASGADNNSGRVSYPATLDGTGFETAIDDVCGAGFEAFIQSDSNSDLRTVFFTE